ncbi:tail fiber domain-containing protein [Vibrio cyclitrophicus]
MSKYYQRQAELKPYTTARADDVRNEFDAIQSAFELLADPRKDGDIGFLTPFTIVDPVEPNHPATHAQVTAEHDKNNEQDARLDNTENLIAGMGPLDARFTTLRYVAEEGQTSIVLPGQFQSLAYVHKNGARLYQTVGFDYDVGTKTISFTEALTLNDEILIDVGVVPDAVLVDLIAIQSDIANRHADIELRNNDVISRQEDVATKHGDVVAKHSDVTDKHSDVTQISADFGDLATLKSDIQESELNASSSASAAATSETNAASSASAASSSASAAAASETNAASSASAASSSASAAAASETNAASSASAASSSASAAAASEANAANSEVNSAGSAQAASSSEVNATASEDSAEASAIAAATSEANASSYAANASASETNAESSAQSAYNEAERSRLYAETSATALISRGDWDASLGAFPEPTMAPERADFYHISAAGVMTNANPAQQDVTVNVGDQLYWHMDKDIWYSIDNTDMVRSVNGQTGDVEISAYSTAQADDLFFKRDMGAASSVVSSEGKPRFTFAVDGHFTAVGNVTAYSDLRLKSNIERIEGALGKVLQLGGYTYDKKRSLGESCVTREVGVIAQEVEVVLPEAVVVDETDPNRVKSVAYGNMVALLIEAIKEQQDQIEELKKEWGHASTAE